MHMVQAFFRQLRWVEKEIIHSLQTPSIIVHGVTDGIIPVHRARDLAQKLPNTTLHVLEQTAHQVMQEKPQETLRLMEEFFVKTL